MIITGFIASLLVSLIFGMYVYKSGLHYKVFSFYYGQYRDAPEPLKFTLPEDVIDQDIIVKNPCGCPLIKGGICPCGSGSNFPRNELNIFNELLTDGPVKDYKPKAEYPTYLRSALGLDNLHPTEVEGNGGAAVRIIDEKPYRGGSIFHLKMGFSKPKVTTEALFAKHKKTPDTIVLVLHGHVSNMRKVLGLDVPDYMRTVGTHLFDRGADVIAFNLTQKNSGSGKLNRLLQTYGTHIIGLWARSVCDVANTLNLRNKYKKVAVYGLSNGGIIADFISVVCKPFDIVVVGDIFTDWRKSVWNKAISPNSGQEYTFYFNRPLFFESSYVDLISSTNSKKIYTGREKYFSRFPFSSARSLTKIPLSKNNQINFVFKNHKEHIVELKILDDIIAENWGNMRGFGMAVQSIQ